MKFIALVEYDYPVEHKPPVKAELVLHGDRVETENVKIIAVDRTKKAAWVPVDDEPHEVWECNWCSEKIYTEDLTNFSYCPCCGSYMTNGGDAE